MIANKTSTNAFTSNPDQAILIKQSKAVSDGAGDHLNAKAPGTSTSTFPTHWVGTWRIITCSAVDVASAAFHSQEVCRGWYILRPLLQRQASSTISLLVPYSLACIKQERLYVLEGLRAYSDCI